MTLTGRIREREYDACACGARKQAESPRCRPCSSRLQIQRTKAAKSQAPVPDMARAAMAKAAMEKLAAEIYSRKQS